MSLSLPSGVSFLQGYTLTCLTHLSPPYPKKKTLQVNHPWVAHFSLLSNTEPSSLRDKSQSQRNGSLMLWFTARRHARRGENLDLEIPLPPETICWRLAMTLGHKPVGLSFPLWHQILQPSLKDHFISRNRYSLKLALAIRNLLAGCRKVLWNLSVEIQLVLMGSGNLPSQLFFLPPYFGNNLTSHLCFSLQAHSILPVGSSFLRPFFLLLQTSASFIQMFLLVILAPHSLIVPRAVSPSCVLPATQIFEGGWLAQLRSGDHPVTQLW